MLAMSNEPRLRDRYGGQPIRERLERGERQAACPPDGVQVIEVGPEELAPYDPHGLLFVNVNTPHDYAEARRVLRPFENRSIAPSPIRGDKLTTQPLRLN